MVKVIKCKSEDGDLVEFEDKIVGSGTMKDCYFHPKKEYAVLFYRDEQSLESKNRLDMITTRYKTSIYNQIGGDYWKDLFCWPQKIVKYNNKLGFIAPIYDSDFFFKNGSINNDFLNIKNKEKEGKWFASAHNQNRFLDNSEKGDWKNYLKICILISRAVRRLHASGLAHSDLSYKNILIDPLKAKICIIDNDALVVPGKYPPDVIGTPDFIAPELVKTSHLPIDHKSRELPKISTDRHSLSVLIYMYLLYRHPLRGCKVNDIHDPANDEKLSMGEKALFVEHPTDLSNRIKVDQCRPSDLPWADTQLLPYKKIVGPYLSKLFERAFIDSLHNPEKRPTADEWESALVKTSDLLQPCSNKTCPQKWYVFDNSTSPICPFCSTPYKGNLPVIDFLSSKIKGRYLPENYRLMVWKGQSLYKWHTNRNVVPNEKISEKDIKRVGYFEYHKNKWWLVNERMNSLYMIENNGADKSEIPIKGKVEIKNDLKLLLSTDEDGRLACIQLANVK